FFAAWFTAPSAESSVGPGNLPVDAEIVRIGLCLGHRLVRLEHLIGDAMLLGIGDRLLARVEIELQLLAHVRGTRPAHQRVRRLGALRLVFEQPLPGADLARLHDIAGRSIDARAHSFLSINNRTHSARGRSVFVSSPGSQTKTGVVGAAGFELATLSSQS